MKAVDLILAALESQPRTRQELQQATGLKRSTIDSALLRLRDRHVIEVRPLEVSYGGPGSHPGTSGRPRGATVQYARVETT